jgi:hypothetical protein
MSDRGVFTISLDTELGWGSFDKGGLARHETAYRTTHEVVDRLCETFERYDVPATWAVVAHLFADCDREHADLREVSGWYDGLPCLRGADTDLWLAPEILDRIRSVSPEQDVGLHGYSHMILGDQPREAARAELDAAVERAQSVGLDPDSFVFPRNRIGHRELLAERGFTVYRGVDARWYERSSLAGPVRKPFRFLEEAASATPPVVTPRERSGLVCVPGSQVFRPVHGGWQYTPEHSQRRRARKGLRRAAETGGIFHLWFHPFNLGRDPDTLCDELTAILSTAAELREAGDLDVLSMAEVATAFENGRWNGSEPEDTNGSAGNRGVS